MNKQEVINQIKKFSELDPNYPCAINRTPNVIHAIEQLDEPQKVKVPAFVAEWFEKNSRKLEEAVYQLNVSIEHTDEQYWGDMFRWADNPENKPIETLIRMLDGYEVEEEPKWVVKVDDNAYFVDFFDSLQPHLVYGLSKEVMRFDSKEKADAIILLIGDGTVEKV